MPVLNKLLNGLIDLVYPKTCLVCKNKLANTTSVDNLVCLGCWSRIKKNPPPFCLCCGRHLGPPDTVPDKNICPGCIKSRPHFDRAFSPCLYEGALKELIHEFKYKGKDYLGRTLSRLMIEFIGEYDLPIGCVDAVIPVPLHKTKMREREFNQAEVLGRCIASAFNKKLLEGALKRHRYTRAQVELTGQDSRLNNVKGSFSLSEKSDIIGKNILLIDDVLTTGATSSEAACTLKSAGAGMVFVLTLAN